MPKRPCAGNCGALVLKGYCPKCERRSPRKLAEQQRSLTRDKRVKGAYDSVAWKRAREGFFAKHPDCVGLKLRPDGPVVINTHPGVVVAAAELDHILPHGGDMVLFWQRSNWQGGCKSCHSVKTATEDGGFGRAVLNR